MDRIADFLKYLESERRLSPHTVTAYRTDLEQFWIFVSEKHGVNEWGKITHLHIRSWLSSMLEQGVTPRSVRRKISSLKSLYRFLVREKAVLCNPMDKIVEPKMSERLPSFVTEPQMECLLQSDDRTDGTYESVRDAAIIETFYALGLRQSELIGLRYGDFDWYALQVRIHGKGDKDRIIPFAPAFRDFLQQYLSVRKTRFGEISVTSYVFVTDRGKPLYPMLVYRIVRKALAWSSVQQKSPHVLRHTFATHLLDEGAELDAIKELLGHASLSATQVYTHTSISKLKEIYKQSHPRE